MAEKQKGISNKKDWLTTANRYVAYVDIMGFKDMIANKFHNEIYEMMQCIYDTRQIIKELATNNNRPGLVKTKTYSDSIILFSKDESSDALRQLILSVAGLIRQLFINGIPHKGAIAFGQMTLDNKKSIIFGQPLIDAYLLQEELNFYGIIIHATAEKRMKDNMEKSGYVEDYLCPLKNGSSKHLTVYPVFLRNPKFKKKVEDMFDSINNLRYITSGYLRRYIDNTEEYLHYIQSK